VAKPVIAVTGAGGFLGQHAVEYFSSRGWQVVGLVRNPDKHTGTKSVSYRKYDLTTGIDSTTLKGVDAVIHAAYAKEGDGIDGYAVNILGAKNLLSACTKHKIRKCIFISSMSSHKDAISVYGKQKFHIEAMFKKAGYLAVRPGFLIGNGGISKQIVDLMKKWHVVPVISGGKQPLQILGIDDLCRALDAGLEKNHHGILTIAHPEVITYRELYRQIANRAQLHIMFLPLPYWLTYFALFCLHTILQGSGVGPENLKGLIALRTTNNNADMYKVGLELPALPEYLDTLNLESV
jgi:nucleoside-diphosphate-sugar epimerase